MKATVVLAVGRYGKYLKTLTNTMYRINGKWYDDIAPYPYLHRLLLIGSTYLIRLNSLVFGGSGVMPENMHQHYILKYYNNNNSIKHPKTPIESTAIIPTYTHIFILT